MLLIGKSLKRAFLVAVVLFDTIMHSNSTTVKFWRSRSFDDLGKRSHVSCLSTFSSVSSLNLLGQFHLNFICSLHAKGERKVYIFGSGHMTKKGAMPI